MTGDRSGPVERPRIAALYARRPQVIKPGLARMEAALGELGPLATRPTVLVAGTNGKGTTTGFLWQLAVGAGLRSGVFTSPHLIQFVERIQHSHVKVDDDLLVDTLEGLERDLSPAVCAALSFFEMSTLIALRLFDRTPTDFLALEVGLGGRFDSTNVVSPDVSVITSIGLDHQEYLGTTPAAIAREKAGIMRPGRLVVWGGARAGAAEADREIRRAAADLGAPLVSLDEEIQIDGSGVVSIRLPGLPPLTATLPPSVQALPLFLRRNFALALAAFYGSRKDAGEVRRAVQAVAAGSVPTPPCLWARFQRLEAAAPLGLTPRPLLLDVGHNPDGARALVLGLKETGALAGGIRLPGLVSVLQDKAHAEILDVLAEALDPILLFACGSERTWRPEMLAERHRRLPFYADFATAFAALPAPSGARPTVVTGSVHAVGEALAVLGLSPLAPAL